MKGRRLTSAKVVKVYVEIVLVVGGLGALVLGLFLFVTPAYVQEHGGDLAVTVGIGSPVFHPRLPLEVATGSQSADPSFLRAGLVDGQAELRAVTTVWSLHFLSMLRLLFGILALLWIFWILRSFLRTVLEGEPFHPANSRRLRTIGLLLVGMALVGPAIEFLFGRSVLTRLAVEGIVLTPALEVPKEALVAGLVFLVFASVFRHGTELEEERSLTV